MARQCRDPGCGRFVKAGTERCDHHPDVPPPDDDGLTFVIDTLQNALRRLTEEKDIEIVGKYVPRVSSVFIQAMRARRQLGGPAKDDYLTFLGPILEELDRNADPGRGR